MARGYQFPDKRTVIKAVTICARHCESAAPRKCSKPQQQIHPSPCEDFTPALSSTDNCCPSGEDPFIGSVDAKSLWHSSTDRLVMRSRHGDGNPEVGTGRGSLDAGLFISTDSVPEFPALAISVTANGRSRSSQLVRGTNCRSRGEILFQRSKSSYGDSSTRFSSTFTHCRLESSSVTISQSVSVVRKY